MKINDSLAIHLFRYLSFRRIINLTMIFTGYLLSRFSGRPVVLGMPAALSIEPTNLCNLKCPECPTGSGELTRQQGKMSFEYFRQIIDQCYKDVFYLQLFFQGEPFLNTQLFEMLRYARIKKIYTSVSTNGHFIEKYADKIMESPPDKLILSLDGLDEPSYQAYRKGGSLSAVQRGLKLLTAKKKELKTNKPFLELQFIVMRENEHLINEARKYAFDNGADNFVLKSLQINNSADNEGLLPQNKIYSRYENIEGTLQLKNKLNNGCVALWKSAVITWDGRVVPCCFDKDAEHSPGNLNYSSFSETWFSFNYNAFRKKVLNNRKSLNICINCSEGMRVSFK